MKYLWQFVVWFVYAILCFFTIENAYMNGYEDGYMDKWLGPYHKTRKTERVFLG